MSAAETRKKKKARRAGRALLVCLLLLCLAGAAALGWMSAAELRERRKGDAFYSRLAKLALADESVPGGKTAPAANENETAAAGGEGKSGESASADAQPSDAPRASEMDFDALRRTCPDAVGWLRLEDSAIDYPVVQGEDNDFYLHHLADGTPNDAGSIMMDSANSGDFRDAVTILHGHHMRSGSMFGRLEDYAQEAYYRAHPTLRLYTPEGDYDAEVFAACTVDGYAFGYPTSFEDEAAFAQFVRRAVSATPYETGVEPRYGERLLMLSTCAYDYTGARYVVLCRLAER